MPKTKLQWTTVKRQVDDLVPYEKNPRVLSPQQETSLKKSLKKFDLVELPAIDVDNKIIAGHQRLRVMQLLGRGKETIETRIPNRKLTQKEYEQYLLTSNAVHGDWSYELLREFDTNLLLKIGFNENDLAHLWDDITEVEDDEFKVDQELQKIQKTNIKPGDLFRLGNHFLICGDSHKQETLYRLMGNKKADMIYNDPIYNIGVDYDKGIGGKASYGGKIKDHKSDDEYREFLKAGLKNSLRHTKDSCHVFTWCDQKNIWLIQTLYQELGVKNERVCFWFKNGFNPTPNVAFNKAVEHCVYGTKGRPYLSKLFTKNCEVLNKEIDTGNRGMDDMLDILEIWMAKRDAGEEYQHSTQKPITLHEKPIKRCSKPGDIILDIYGGSGSTLISCEQLKRICYTAEIEPIFCQLIINRFESYANIKAKKNN